MSSKASKIKINDSYTACSIVGGFSGEDNTPAEELAAWGYLIKTGQVWTLQGWYSRQAQALIGGGYISKSGKVLAKYCPECGDPYLDNLVSGLCDACHYKLDSVTA